MTRLKEVRAVRYLRASILHLAILSTPSLIGACTKVDACEREWPQDHEVNRLTEGAQSVLGPEALGALPQGGSLLVFRSDAFVASSSEQQVIRGVILDPRATPLNTCQAGGEITYTTPDPSKRLRNTLPAVSPPATETGTGMLAYVQYDEGDPSSQIMGQQLRASGCTLNEAPPFPISTEPKGYKCEECKDCEPGTNPPIHCLGPPTIARLENGSFAVLWIVSHRTALDVEQIVRARIVVPDFLGPRFAPTALIRDGSPAELTSLGGATIAIATVGLPDNVLAVAWHENSLVEKVSTKLQLFNSSLEPTTDPVVLHASDRDLFIGANVHMAVNDDRILVAWIALDEDEMPRVFARVVRGEKNRLLFPKENPKPFRVSRTECGAETDVAVTAIHADRAAFVVAWHAASCHGSAARIRAAVLDENGLPVFSNHACDATDFVLADANLDESRVALATTVEGVVTAAWTDRGSSSGDSKNGDDRSLSAVRGAALRLDQLIPVSP